MRLVRPADWFDMPWRNGGGVTSEILAERRGGAILWRMSTAIVHSDGAYSAFPGLMRISTTIEGAGTVLRDPDSGIEVDIPPLTPTLLNGDVEWQGTLKDGPIRHFNLIFDPRAVRVSVEVLRVYGAATTQDDTVLFCVDGSCTLGTDALERHDLAIAPPGPIRGTSTLLKIEHRLTS